jgi:undecaprenyl diphosphate synthase
MAKSSVSDQHIPQHIAIICDGNRRWARRRGLPEVMGHKHAVDSVLEDLVEHAAARSIKYITFWIFSTENWSRSQSEVNALMDLFRHAFDTRIESMNQKGVRFKMIGDIAGFSPDIQDRIQRGIEKTAHNDRITVTLAMNYGGRDELLRATKKLATEAAAGTLDPDSITQQVISDSLDTAGTPNPDFVIRTGGEHRLSGYLLWQIEYAELFFPDYFFPDFTPEKLDEALAEFAHRQRRFGK